MMPIFPSPPNIILRGTKGVLVTGCYTNEEKTKKKREGASSIDDDA